MLYVIWDWLHALHDEAMPGSRKNQKRRALKQVLVLALVGGALCAFALTRHKSNAKPAPLSTPMSRHGTHLNTNTTPRATLHP